MGSIFYLQIVIYYRMDSMGGVTDMKNLPTKDEYIQQNSYIVNPLIQQFSEPKYKCPKCESGGMCKDLTKICTSLPPKYIYQCNSCGYIEYLSF